MANADLTDDQTEAARDRLTTRREEIGVVTEMANHLRAARGVVGKAGGLL